jgi:hypothetical protein
MSNVCISSLCPRQRLNKAEGGNGVIERKKEWRGAESNPHACRPGLDFESTTPKQVEADLSFVTMLSPSLPKTA